MLIELIQNVALLVGMAVGFEILTRRLEGRRPWYQLALGLLFGAFGIVGMMNPVQYEAGIIYDGRTIVLSIAGLFGGPLAAALSMFLCAVYRLHLGGVGAVPGVMTILAAGTLGVVFYALRKRSEAWVSPPVLLGFGVLVSASMMGFQLLLPDRTVLGVARELGPVIMTVYPLGTVIVALVFLEGEKVRGSQRRMGESEQRLQLALAGGALGTWDYNVVTGEASYDERWAEMLGYPLDEVEMRYTFWESLLHPDDREAAVRAVRDHLEGRTPEISMEVRLRHKDGSWVWVIGRGRVSERDRAGKATRASGTHMDITERKRAEEAASEARDLLAKLTDQVPGVVYQFQWFPDGRSCFPIASSGMWDIYEVRPEDVVEDATVVYGRLHPDDLERVVAEIKESARTLDDFDCEFRVVLPGQGLRWRASHAKPGRLEDGSTLWHGVITDITERKEAELAVRENEARFRGLLDRMEIIPVQGYDDARRVIYWNEASERVYGYTRDEALGRKLEDLIIPDAMREGVVRGINDWIDGGQPIRPEEITLRRKDGSPVPVFSSHLFHETATGRKELYCVDVDLTAMRAAEKELRRLFTAISQAAEMVVITDPEGRIEYVNPAFEEITGFERAEVLGRPLDEVQTPTSEIEAWRDAWDTVAAGNVWKGRARSLRRDGSTYTEEVTLSPVRGGAGDITNFVAVKNDISAQLELEQQYRQAQKLEAVGQLTGGVAHDFNNLLQVINGYAAVGLEHEDLDPEVAEALGEIADAGRRAASLVSQLLLFSRRSIMRLDVVAPNSVVEQMLRMLKRVIGEHYHLEWIPGQHLGAVEADRTMLEQVLLNLCINARDAMPDGGEIAIETENVLIGEEYCSQHAWAVPGRYVLLSVTDSGHGMDEDTLAHIYEPFFTTKKPGEGTGLGLATVYGIVKQHDGMITAYSEVGKGTTFKVYLPICERRAEEVGTKIEGRAGGGAERILLAEDDDTVRRLAVLTLERAGYSVVAVRDGAEAVRVFSASPGAFDMAMLDVVMPGMGGREAFEQMRDIRPDFKVLFASGYSENAIHTNFVLEDHFALVQKPYRRDDLLRAIRERLDE